MIKFYNKEKNITFTENGIRAMKGKSTAKKSKLINKDLLKTNYGLHYKMKTEQF